MQETLTKTASILVIFVLGCIVGFSALYLHMRISALETQQVLFQKNVEQFAKQVNDEFAKLRKPETKK